MIHSENHFYATIGYSKKEIADVLSNIDKGYYEFTEEKSNGRLRIYEPSQRSLKDIQKRLISRVFSNVTFPFYITGSVKKRSAVINAKFHSGKKHHFKTDLSNYFGFVTHKMVYQALLQLGLSADIARLITKLTTYKGHLPQGAPTSPFLANIVGYRIDEEILKICQDANITYTRYVDDIVLSSDTDFKTAVPDILGVILKQGFYYSQKKTKYKIGNIVITGVDTTCNGLKPTVSAQEKYLKTTKLASKKGLEGHFNYVEKISISFNTRRFKSTSQTLQFPEKIRINPPKKTK